MKTIYHLILFAILATILASCGDEDESLRSNIVGNWSGTVAYYNPVGGTKYQYLSVDFYENGTGKLEYEAPLSTSFGYFSYSITRNKISVQGGWGSSYGDVDSDFFLTFNIEGDRLIPVEKYSNFILTRDGSVMTNTNGQEVPSPDSIEGVWIEDKGYSIIRFYLNGTCDEYIRTSPWSDKCSETHEFRYEFMPFANRLNIGGTVWEVTSYNPEAVLLLFHDRTILNYRRGTNADIPRLSN